MACWCPCLGAGGKSKKPQIPPASDKANLASSSTLMKQEEVKREATHKDQEILLSNGSENHRIAAQTFFFRELAAATTNFRADCLQGEGGFGRVYKGYLERVNQAGEKYHASSISLLKSRTAPLSLMKTAMSTVLSFSFERLCKVAGFRMVGVHVIGTRKNLTNQTMMFPAQLKPELRTKLVRTLLVSEITVQDDTLKNGLG